MVNFVHFSDLHVDHYQRGKRGKDFALRVYDMLAHLDTIIDFSIDHKVDFVLFGGDMYHTHKPKQEMRAEVHKRILKLVDAGIPFYGVPGNHDMIKRETAKDALHELTSLRVPKVHIFHEPGVLDCGDYAVAGVPWLYTDFDVRKMDLPDKPVFAAVHATILGAVYGSGVETSELALGREFVLPLEDLERFDYVGLGHIHKPQILCEDPYIIYPGSVGWQSWGEAKDPPHTFVYYKDGKIESIEFEDRLRYKYELEKGEPIPRKKELDAFYKFVVPDGYDVPGLYAHYDDVYNVDVNVVRKRTERRYEQNLDALPKMSPKEQLKMWFEVAGEDFSEVEEIFEEIADGI